MPWKHHFLYLDILKQLTNVAAAMAAEQIAKLHQYDELLQGWGAPGAPVLGDGFEVMLFLLLPLLLAMSKCQLTVLSSAEFMERGTEGERALKLDTMLFLSSCFFLPFHTTVLGMFQTISSIVSSILFVQSPLPESPPQGSGCSKRHNFIMSCHPISCNLTQIYM